jgi:hypothetical protein
MRKRLYQISTAILCSVALNVSAQVKPYLAIVRTSGETIKGVLYQVSPDSICIKTDQSKISFCPTMVKSIKIKEISKNSKYLTYLGQDSYQARYLKVSKKMKPVRTWGEKTPTIEEELSGRIITGVYNAALNGIASSFRLMNGNSKFLNVNYDKLSYNRELNSLSAYCLQKQLGNQVVNNASFQSLAKGN